MRDDGGAQATMTRAQLLELVHQAEAKQQQQQHGAVGRGGDAYSDADDAPVTGSSRAGGRSASSVLPEALSAPPPPQLPQPSQADVRAVYSLIATQPWLLQGGSGGASSAGGKQGSTSSDGLDVEPHPNQCSGALRLVMELSRIDPRHEADLPLLAFQIEGMAGRVKVLWERQPSHLQLLAHPRLSSIMKPSPFSLVWDATTANDRRGRGTSIGQSRLLTNGAADGASATESSSASTSSGASSAAGTAIIVGDDAGDSEVKPAAAASTSPSSNGDAAAAVEEMETDAANEVAAGPVTYPSIATAMQTLFPRPERLVDALPIAPAHYGYFNQHQYAALLAQMQQHTSTLMSVLVRSSDPSEPQWTRHAQTSSSAPSSLSSPPSDPPSAPTSSSRSTADRARHMLLELMSMRQAAGQLRSADSDSTGRNTSDSSGAGGADGSSPTVLSANSNSSPKQTSSATAPLQQSTAASATSTVPTTYLPVPHVPVPPPSLRNGRVTRHALSSARSAYHHYGPWALASVPTAAAALAPPSVFQVPMLDDRRVGRMVSMLAAWPYLNMGGKATGTAASTVAATGGGGGSGGGGGGDEGHERSNQQGVALSGVETDDDREAMGSAAAATVGSEDKNGSTAHGSSSSSSSSAAAAASSAAGAGGGAATASGADELRHLLAAYYSELGKMAGDARGNKGSWRASSAAAADGTEELQQSPKRARITATTAGGSSMDPASASSTAPVVEVRPGRGPGRPPKVRMVWPGQQSPSAAAPSAAPGDAEPDASAAVAVTSPRVDGEAANVAGGVGGAGIAGAGGASTSPSAITGDAASSSAAATTADGMRRSARAKSTAGVSSVPGGRSSDAPKRGRPRSSGASSVIDLTGGGTGDAAAGATSSSSASSGVSSLYDGKGRLQIHKLDINKQYMHALLVEVTRMGAECGMPAVQPMGRVKLPSLPSVERGKAAALTSSSSEAVAAGTRQAKPQQMAHAAGTERTRRKSKGAGAVAADTTAPASTVPASTVRSSTPAAATAAGVTTASSAAASVAAAEESTAAAARPVENEENADDDGGDDGGSSKDGGGGDADDDGDSNDDEVALPGGDGGVDGTTDAPSRKPTSKAGKRSIPSETFKLHACPHCNYVYYKPVRLRHHVLKVHPTEAPVFLKNLAQQRRVAKAVGAIPEYVLGLGGGLDGGDGVSGVASAAPSSSAASAGGVADGAAAAAPVIPLSSLRVPRYSSSVDLFVIGGGGVDTKLSDPAFDPPFTRDEDVLIALGG